MRLREITETRQLNEFLPIIGAIGATVIPGLGGMTIAAFLGAVFTVWTVWDIYDYAVKIYKDPKSMEVTDWAILVFEIAAMKGPLKMLSKAARDKIFNAIPDSVKEGMGKAVKEKVMKEVEKDTAKTADKAADTADDIYKPQPRRNRVDSVPSAKKAEPTPTSPEPTTAKKPPKDPNLIDRPYQKEDLLRLAGLAK